MLTMGPVSKMASQQEKAFCVLRFEVSRSVITVQHEFCAWFRKDAWCIFSKACTKLTLHCNHRSGHLKTEHTESLFLLRRHLGNWPHSKHEKRTAGSAWETWTVAAADCVRCARVRREINFLLTFETAPLFVYTLCMYIYIYIFFIHFSTDLVGLLTVEFSRTHSHTPHSVRLLWTGDRTAA